MPTREEKIKELKKYRDSIKNRKLEPQSSNHDRALYDGHEYHRFADLLAWANCDDVDYAEHVNFRDGWNIHKELSKVQNFTFRQCCAFATLIWRSERAGKHWFVESFNNGNLFKLVDRLIETMP